MAILESIDEAGNSYQAYNIGHVEGTASGVYQYTGFTSATDLKSVPPILLGQTIPAVAGIYHVNRFVPTVHPIMPWLYAQNVTSMLGLGAAGANVVASTAPPLTGDTSTCSTYLLYDTYQIKVGFASLPYTVLPDSEIANKSGSWYPDNATSTTAFTYSPEWMRYTTYDIIPQNNTIQGQTGQFTFHGGVADRKNFTSPPWFYLPDSIIKFRWYQVPYSYITSTNSYIANKNWQGRINQNDWYNWPKGSLLYLSYDVKKYVEPTGGYTQSNTDLNGNTWTSYSQLCDIEFTFLLTNRTVTTAPPAPYYGNWIPYGHNLLPYLGGDVASSVPPFYYATTTKQGDDTNQQYWRPAWASCPFELMFSNPDA